MLTRYAFDWEDSICVYVEICIVINYNPILLLLFSLLSPSISLSLAQSPSNRIVHWNRVFFFVLIQNDLVDVNARKFIEFLCFHLIILVNNSPFLIITVLPYIFLFFDRFFFLAFFLKVNLNSVVLHNSSIFFVLFLLPIHWWAFQDMNDIRYWMVFRFVRSEKRLNYKESMQVILISTGVHSEYVMFDRNKTMLNYLN